MIIKLNKFGEILTSREAGREALSAFMPTLNSISNNEKITIDFSGVSVLTPSWADEFIRPLLEKHNWQINFINDENPSVQAAMQFANPNLDLSHVNIIGEILYFNCKDHSDEFGLGPLKFPYSDTTAIEIIQTNKITKIIGKIENTKYERIKYLKTLFANSGIELIIQ
jgi:hypothetical protein